MSELVLIRGMMATNMNEYVRVLGDENLTEKWLMGGVPDGSTPNDILNDVEDVDTFVEWLECFTRIVKSSTK